MATAPWIAAAQSGVSLGLLPFAVFPAAFPASVSKCRACLRRRFAFFGELPALGVVLLDRGDHRLLEPEDAPLTREEILAVEVQRRVRLVVVHVDVAVHVRRACERTASALAAA